MVQRSFNNWAQGKALTKDVIIHTHYGEYEGGGEKQIYLCIVVFHPEDTHWITEPSQ